MKAGDLTKSVMSLLWERFTLGSEATEEDAKAALTLLAMAANSEPSIIMSNRALIVSHAFGERG